MEAIEEIKTIEWQNICEEDWYDARRRTRKKGKSFVCLVYWDSDGNIYHYIPKNEVMPNSK